ncbi:MAG TPA: MauE/DoxX family redox-associated membrane protein [Ilumatobacteraceae bacterium]|nr:MauE/DoxX family redox-associated membrane protein [Ilumatobacteraceae bacterium]
MSVVGVVAAVLVAIVFLVAGVSKTAAPDRWRSEAAGMGVRGLLVTVTPWVELVVGALLAVQFQRHVVAWCAVALLIAFTVLLLVRLAQGRRPVCACFGSLSQRPIGAVHVVRNAVFLALAVTAALA